VLLFKRLVSECCVGTLLLFTVGTYTNHQVLNYGTYWGIDIYLATAGSVHTRYSMHRKICSAEPRIKDGLQQDLASASLH
jgi:hypothetical protein